MRIIRNVYRILVCSKIGYGGGVKYPIWDLGVQISRSPRPEGVRRCPVACWKATFMYFTKIKQNNKKSFRKIFFDSRKIFGSKCSDFSQIFWKSNMFRKNQKFSSKIFSRVEKYFPRNFFFNRFFIFVKYMNVAFQQATGHLLTPSGRGERAVWVPRALSWYPPPVPILLQGWVGTDGVPKDYETFLATFRML